MILSRVIEHVKTQNWTAVALDFVIVVMGVFIGLQVSNWNERQADRRSAQAYMERLEQDVRQSITLTQASLDFMQHNAELADEALRDLRACGVSEGRRDALATGLYRLGKIETATLVQTTIDELREAGRMNLIGSAELRASLNEIVRQQESHKDVFAIIAERLEPHIEYIDSRVIYEIQKPVGGDADLSWEDIDFDFNAACKDRRFLTAVGAGRNYTFDTVTDVTRMRDRLTALLGLIERLRE